MKEIFEQIQKNSIIGDKAIGQKPALGHPFSCALSHTNTFALERMHPRGLRQLSPRSTSPKQTDITIFSIQFFNYFV